MLKRTPYIYSSIRWKGIPLTNNLEFWQFSQNSKHSATILYTPALYQEFYNLSVSILRGFRCEACDFPCVKGISAIQDCKGILAIQDFLGIRKNRLEIIEGQKIKRRTGIWTDWYNKCLPRVRIYKCICISTSELIWRHWPAYVVIDDGDGRRW